MNQNNAIVCGILIHKWIYGSQEVWQGGSINSMYCRTFESAGIHSRLVIGSP